MYKNYIQNSQKTSFLFISLSVLLFFFTNETQAQTIVSTDDVKLRRDGPPAGKYINGTWEEWSDEYGGCMTSHSRTSGEGYDWIDGILHEPPRGHTYFMTCHRSEYAYANIHGLTPGKEYTLTFYVAGFQSNHYDDSATELTYFVSIGFSQEKTFTFNPSVGWIKQTYTFTAPPETANRRLTLKGDTNPSYALSPYIHYSLGADAIRESSTSCKAGTDFPSLSTTTINSKCPTADLTTITVSNLPTGTSLTWHTGTPPTNANKITGSIKAVTPGTYYAAFYDADNDCYGNATAVTVTSTTNVGTEGPRW